MTTWRERVADARLPATACLTALTVVTVVAHTRVFADHDFLRPMLAVAVGLHVLAATLRVVRAPVWVAFPVQVIGAVELLALAYYRSTMTGPLPTMRTWEMVRIDLRLVADQFSTAVAPVPSTGSYAIVAAVGIALVVLLSDAFAFRAMGQMEAVVPAGILFIITAALGVDRDRVLLATVWVAVALLTAGVLRFQQRSDDIAWVGGRRARLLTAFPAIALAVSVSAVAAAAVAPRLPGAGEKGLVDTRNRLGSVTEVLSPLVDIRANIVNRSNLQMFTVTSSDGGHYWRVIGLPRFDGNAWNPPEETLVPMGNRSDDVTTGTVTVDQVFEISGLGGSLVPAAYHPVQVSPDDVYWAADSESLVLPDGNVLNSGDSIAVRSLVPNPSQAELLAATASGAPAAYYELPDSAWAAARPTAVTVTAGAATPYEQALALQNWFRTNFTYDTDVQLGNSTDAITAFLRDRRGFCQQFAGTFAVMARSIGLPARVAVGFTPGELQADGKYHVYGRHAHAWPEVWFDGIGWIPFEPTPGRGSSDSEPFTGVPAAQEGASAGTGGSGQGGSSPTPTTRPQDPDANPDDPRDGGAAGGGADGTGGTPTPSAPQQMPAALLAVPIVLGLLALWALIVPFVARWRARRQLRSPAERVVGAWHRARTALTLAGVEDHADDTPVQFAIRADRAVPVDHRTVRTLADQVTKVVYAESDVDDTTAATMERLSVDVQHRCRDLQSWWTRLRMRLDPRLAWRLASG